jgi:predicted 3-demethylubiquinone-9 3-methyltransferase (glyoxalase superfamily)
MSKLGVCLWCDGNGEELADFYVAAFRACGREASVGAITRYGDAGPGPKGAAMTVSFTLGDLEIMALNGGALFSFSEAISLVVKCADQAEVDRFWAALSAGGKEVQCGWIKDKFGLSWQIVPNGIMEMYQDPDPARTGRVMKAMQKMVKLDIATLKAAYDG